MGYRIVVLFMMLCFGRFAFADFFSDVKSSAQSSAQNSVKNEVSKRIPAGAKSAAASPAAAKGASDPKCTQAQQEWKKACGCDLSIVIDVGSVAGKDHLDMNTPQSFVYQAGNLCESIYDGRDIGGTVISIGSFCKGREAQMCKIKQIRVVRANLGTPTTCKLSGGTATAVSDGQMMSLIDNCYKQVTKW